MNKWPYRVSSLTRSEITEYVIDPEWQTFRKSLKGKSTTDKLCKLANWRADHLHNGKLDRGNEVRIDNYINALLRGGQLNSELKVVK